jgi:hypothetical protein
MARKRARCVERAQGQLVRGVHAPEVGLERGALAPGAGVGARSRRGEQERGAGSPGSGCTVDTWLSRRSSVAKPPGSYSHWTQSHLQHPPSCMQWPPHAKEASQCPHNSTKDKGHCIQARRQREKKIILLQQDQHPSIRDLARRGNARTPCTYIPLKGEYMIPGTLSPQNPTLPGSTLITGQQVGWSDLRRRVEKSLKRARRTRFAAGC